MYKKKSLLIASYIFAALILIPVFSSQAYIGPGAGFAIVGSFMAFFFAFIAALISMIVWPVRAVYIFIQKKRLGLRPKVERVIILGLDGMDPRYAGELMSQGKLPNFKKLMERGSFSPLKTTYPSVSPVAWSTFMTGVNPGKHCIYDFLMPDWKTYLPTLSSTYIGSDVKTIKLGKYRIPIGSPEIRLLRRSQPFWKVLGDHFIFSNVLRVPITFPPEKFYGTLLSAMCVPDLRGSQGTFSFYTSNQDPATKHTGGVQIAFTKNGDGSYAAALKGPVNSLVENGGDMEIPFTLSPNGGDGSWNLTLPDQKINLRPGEYTGWITLTFKAGLGIKVTGIARMMLLRTEPAVDLYVTPINIDPVSPAMPISHPTVYATCLARLQGPYATLGLAEDTWALNERVIDEQGFWDQTWSNHAEREDMFFRALDHTHHGACVCVFDTTDRLQHMFFRYLDPDHPANRGKDMKAFENAIEELYVRMDDLTGRVMNKLKDKDLFIVMSDHGFRLFKRGVNINSWLWKNGYLVTKDNKESGELFANVDWDKTRAYALGLTGLYLNLQGREAKGIVEPKQEAKALRQELKKKLSGMKDPDNGNTAINEAFSREEIFHGPYVDVAPDLVIGFNEGYRTSWDGAMGYVNDVVFEDNEKSWSGDHCMDPRIVPGVLFCNRKIDADDPGIVDIAPTVLRMFDVPIPKYMDGKPLIRVDDKE